MFRIVSLLPAILVAVIITVITSLYLRNLNTLEELRLSNEMMKNALQDKERLLEESLNKVKDLERQALISNQSEKVIIEKEASKVQPEIPEVKLAPEESQAKSVETKINSIAKFVPLNENQKQRLREKFTAELDPSVTNNEKLEDIIGKENADFYREQRKNAFERVLQESIEKEILFVARKLSLAPAQEDAFRKAYFEIEEELRLKREGQNQQPNSNTNTLEKLVLEEKERNKMLTERMKDILNGQQYKDFLNYQSGNQDMQLWHEK